MKNILKYSSILLLLFLTLIVLGTTCLYFINITITKFHIVIFLILSISIYYLLNKKKIDKKEYIKVTCFSILIILFSILISTYTFDRSSDGNTYHKDAIGVLKEGFNPVYESSYDFIVKRDNNDTLTNYSIWTDHYAKANWIIAANFYSLTNNIESGKAMNFISLFIVFGIIYTSLLNIFNNKKSLIISILTVLNPITAPQLFTYYNDQLVCLYLFLSIFMLIKIDKDINSKENWFIYILSFILLTNTKFNGFGYLLVFSFLFVCKYLYKAYKNKEFLNLFKKLCIIFIPLFIVSIVIVGYPTYIKNTLDHSNPFFPLYDKNGEDIITEQQPKKFLKMNNLEKLFYGTFSKANNLRENDNTDLKIPFTISKEEIKPALSNDLRISGWGLLFSGLLIISIIIFIKKYKNYKKEDYILFSLLVTSILLIVMSESWWARYTPHFYLFILLSLYILLKYNNKKIINIIYISLVTINTLIPLLGNTYYVLTNSIKINKELNRLSNKEIIINKNAYNGIMYNLKDYKIKYKSDNIEGKKLYYNYLEYKEL